MLVSTYQLMGIRESDYGNSSLQKSGVITKDVYLMQERHVMTEEVSKMGELFSNLGYCNNDWCGRMEMTW